MDLNCIEIKAVILSCVPFVDCIVHCIKVVGIACTYRVSTVKRVPLQISN